MARLFLDMDGVLTDFDGQFEKWFGRKVQVAHYKTDGKIKNIIDQHLVEAPIEFWSQMPWLPGAKEFWDQMVPRTPIILSAPHFARHCVLGKMTWVQNQLGRGVPVILDTAKSAHGIPGDLLGDDSPANAVGWLGHFVLHKNWEETRRQIGDFPYLCEYEI